MRRFFLFLFLIPASCFAQLSATPVQSKGFDTGAATSTTLSGTLDAAPTQGNYLVMALVAAGPAVKVASTNTRWVQVGPQSYNTTQGGGTQIWVGYADASAGTGITVTVGTAAAAAMAAVVAEFTGKNVQLDSIPGTNTGSSTSPSVTIAASNNANVLQVAVISTRGTWSAQTAVFSNPTNGMAFLDGSTTTGTAGTMQRNSTINSSNSDRAVTLLVKVIADGATVTAGATQSTNAWSATGASLAEVRRGFFISP